MTVPHFILSIDLRKNKLFLVYVQVKELIEVGGGAVMWEKEVSHLDKKFLANAIKLVTPVEASLLAERNVKVRNAFHVQYVIQCIKESAILMNLSHFKVTK